MIRHRFRTEARLNIGFALFAMALVSLSLTDNPDTPSVWFIAVFDLLLVIWIVLNLGYGTLTMSPRKLLVRGYVRATRIPLAEIASFDSVEARRGG